jgi:hypothetical protein
MSDLPLSVATRFFMKFRGPKAHSNRPQSVEPLRAELRELRSCAGYG